MLSERSAPYQVPTRGGHLAVDVSGDPSGVPVFFLHGMPGSRHGPKPRPSVLYRLGVRLITYDRPGYGGSSRHKGRSVADAARDVATIADGLGLDHFAVVGRSGGGPHALACAALLGERVRRTAALMSVAPPDADGLDWFQGMTEDNTDAYTAAREDERTFARELRLRAKEVKDDPDSILARLEKEMTEPDRFRVRDFALRQLLAQSYVEGLREGADGWIDDVLAICRNWRFDLDRIGGPVHLWHGVEDNFAPVAHAEWLAGRIPNSVLDVQDCAAHFAAGDALMELLPWLIDWPYTPGPASDLAVAASGRPPR